MGSDGRWRIFVDYDINKAPVWARLLRYSVYVNSSYGSDNLKPTTHLLSAAAGSNV